MNDHISKFFNKLKPLVIVISYLTFLLASASDPIRADASQLPSSNVSPQPSAPPGALPADDLWERIRLDLSWQAMQKPQVDSARRQLLRQSNYLPAMTHRADSYLHYIVEEVQKRDMPVEIAFIPVIESSLNPFASGPSGAAGLWQILPETGIHLGLEQNSRYDGRRSLQDSTTVALDYLETLYEEFDEDWLLAVAAYNSGAGNVTRAREANAAKGLDTDFWSLNLPRHTQEYIPKLIALAQIVADPEHFDVEIPAVDNAPAFEIVDAAQPLDMSQAAKLAGVDIDTMRALNPGQLGQSSGPNLSGEILVPVGTRDRFEYNIAQLTPEELVQWQTYRIRSGDSLDLIARKFDTQVAVLQEANGLRGSNIRAGATLKIPDHDGAEGAPAVLTTPAASTQTYQVRKGDSLSGIAAKFKVPVNNIVAWNALDRHAFLQPGQTLTLHITGG